MKNFDEARKEREQADRSFQLGGEVFVRKSGVRPEVIAQYETINTDVDAQSMLNTVDGVILQMIDDIDGAHDRYKALRLRDVEPVTLEDLNALMEWLIEEMTGRRPTQPASPSTAGPKKTGTRSTAASSSRDATTASPA